MASPSSTLVSFINNALYNTPLPYTDPTQKSTIRAHLLDTLQTFPSLTLSLDSYTSLNGVVSPLFKLSGTLPTPSLSFPNLALSLWVHQDYPHISPILLTPTGPTSTRYLRAWRHPTSTLLGLLLALLENPPAGLAFSPRKVNALAMIQRGILAMEARHVAEVDALVAIQGGVRSRGECIDRLIKGLENEVLCLERSSRDMRLHVDVLANWVRVNCCVNGEGLDHEVVEGVDEESRWLVECLAVDRAIEDVMYALDKAVEEGVLGFEVYMRQIRVLARDQFLVRARLVKFKGPSILHYLY